MTDTPLNGKFFRFKECKYRLYYYDTKKEDDEAEENNTIDNNTIIDYSCIQNVKENTNFLTK